MKVRLRMDAEAWERVTKLAWWTALALCGVMVGYFFLTGNYWQGALLAGVILFSMWSMR